MFVCLFVLLHIPIQVDGAWWHGDPRTLENISEDARNYATMGQGVRDRLREFYNCEYQVIHINVFCGGCFILILFLASSPSQPLCHLSHSDPDQDPPTTPPLCQAWTNQPPDLVLDGPLAPAPGDELGLAYPVVLLQHDNLIIRHT